MTRCHSTALAELNSLKKLLTTSVSIKSLTRAVSSRVLKSEEQATVLTEEVLFTHNATYLIYHQQLNN